MALTRVAAAGIALLLAAETTTSLAAAPQVPPSAAEPVKKAPAPDLAVVERRLLEAVRAQPGSFEAHRALATFYLGRRKLDAAIPHLQRAKAINPPDYANSYDLALALLETGKLEPARAEVTRLLAIQDTGELHNLIGNVEEHAGRLVEAAREYEIAAHKDPTESHLFDWGNDLIQLSAFDPAEQVFSAALERHPRSARLNVGHGIVQYARGQYDDAVKSFCRAADLDPADPRAYQFLGEMYGVVPLGTDVAERFARFVKAQPRNALAHFHYAMILWRGQSESPPADLARVEALLKRAVTLDPKLVKALFELGVLLSDQERYPEAIDVLRRAIALEPDQAQAHYRLARAYQRAGRQALAAQELEKFQQLKAGAR